MRSDEKGGEGASSEKRGLKKMSRTKKWREEVHGIKQPCWCGEMWTDYHEDGRHGPVWVEDEK